MTKLKEGLRVNITMEKLSAFFGILAIMWAMGNQLWADKTDVELLKKDITYIKIDLEKISKNSEFVKKIFEDAIEASINKNK